MNEKQKLVLILALATIVAMLIYPPFHFELAEGTFRAGYAWIGNPKQPAAKVDIGLLITQWIGTLIVGGLGVLIFKDR